jgi:hypothetical protein
MTTRDNNLNLLVTGQANWDSDLNVNANIAERGYHVTEHAGVGINTGQVLWLNSGGFFFPLDPNSSSAIPHALAFTAAASGDSMQALAWGIVRSLAINSPAVPGQALYVSALTPGVIVGSYSGADRPIGFGLPGYSVMFRPGRGVIEQLTSSLAIQAVTGSLHVFTMDPGKWGWNRYTKMIGNSADLVELKFYSDSGRTVPLYSTLSGGVTTVGSFYDRAGWPYENTDAALKGIIYGSLKIMSAAAVGSDTISVQNQWDRSR